MSIRSAASWSHPLQRSSVPRGATIVRAVMTARYSLCRARAVTFVNAATSRVRRPRIHANAVLVPSAPMSETSHLSELVLREDHGGVRTLFLNRPAKKNAFDPDHARAFTTALASADADPSVKVVVVTGSGDVFCGGADVSVFLAIGAGQMEQVLPVKRVPHAIGAVNKPILAAVQGPAIGMGVTMLPYFDVVYAATTASFTVPFVHLGLVQEFGSSWTLSRLLGRQRAAELLLRGTALDAPTAERWGLVARTFEPTTLLDEVRAIATEIARAPQGAVQEAKSLLRSGELERSPAEAEAAEDAALAKRYGSPENVQAVQAFLASRRKP
jgi:enoyl-CoA hydratase/carnithine racemase